MRRKVFGVVLLVFTLTVPLSEGAADTAGGWVKYAQNPVMGGKYGTCFDISVMKEGEAYRMWLSWRPKQSVAPVSYTHLTLPTNREV